MFDIFKTVASVAAHPIAALAALASPIVAFAPAFAIALDQPSFAAVGRRSHARKVHRPAVSAPERLITIPATTQPLSAHWEKITAVVEATRRTAAHARELHETATLQLESAEFSLDRLFDEMSQLITPTPEMIAARDRLKAGRGPRRLDA